jgi:hypothetical protein
MPSVQPDELVCVDCGRTSTGPEKGWRAVLAGGYEDELEVPVYCPECVEQEFR